MPTDEQAIRDLFAAWKQATLAKDVETLLTFVTDDVIFLAPGQPPIRGKAAMEALYRQVLGLYRFEQDWVFEEIQAFGDWGFCWGRDSSTMTPLDGGPAVKASGMGLSILSKQPDGTWLVARGINNMTRQPAAIQHAPNSL
ncbi:MAG TPA: SgcJ/EcaC family oxidoreductase [Thermoanaerobaculia bacterium]|nr:SgcJ/EcaC family oxidoreductase [Thermoanaerobaculia bacterium]